VRFYIMEMTVEEMQDEDLSPAGSAGGWCEVIVVHPRNDGGEERIVKHYPGHWPAVVTELVCQYGVAEIDEISIRSKYAAPHQYI
jgi:hypothetical protein